MTALEGLGYKKVRYTDYLEWFDQGALEESLHHRILQRRQGIHVSSDFQKEMERMTECALKIKFTVQGKTSNELR